MSLIKQLYWVSSGFVGLYVFLTLIGWMFL